jgi:hypothetical protein
MSRRSGQNGSIELRGNTYYARFRLDVPGQEQRLNKRVRIWPKEGPGSLNSFERKRRRAVLKTEPFHPFVNGFHTLESGKMIGVREKSGNSRITVQRAVQPHFARAESNASFVPRYPPISAASPVRACARASVQPQISTYSSQSPFVMFARSIFIFMSRSWRKSSL